MLRSNAFCDGGDIRVCTHTHTHARTHARTAGALWYRLCRQ